MGTIKLYDRNHCRNSFHCYTLTTVYLERNFKYNTIYNGIKEIKMK